MSKEFQDRLARGQLTNTEDYRRMKQALSEIKSEDKATSDSSDNAWEDWELSPEWSASDQPAAEGEIKDDSVQRALDRMDKSAS